MAGLTDRIYSSSPIWVQQLGVALYGWRWYRRRFNPHFYRLVAELESREHWTFDQFNAYQEDHLICLLAAAQNAPYYRKVFADAGVRLAGNPFEILRNLPFLSKETLRTVPEDLITQRPIPKDVIVFKSSGTTGTPTEIYYTPELHALELALPAVRNMGWAQVDYRARRVMFGVRKVCRFEQDRPPFWRYSPAENMAYASIYHLSPKYLPAYIDFLRSYRPAMIMGYPNSLYTIARYALDNNDFPARAQGVFTTSETVTDQIREALESAWQCKVYDRYGAVENCMFASQCEYGSYHVSPEAGIIEILDRMGQPCKPGEIGEVICTGLQNLLQPLIRYRIGDAARWALEQNCPCGRSMPVLEAIEGRFEDICITSDGRELLRFDTVFKGVHGIKESQIVQEKVDHFTVYVVPAENYTDRDQNLIRANMRLHVGDVQTEIKPVDALMRSSSGKFRSVICNLTEAEKISIRQESPHDL